MEAAWIDLENIEITDTPDSIIPGSVRDFLNSVDEYLADELDRTAQISDSPNEEITDWLLAAREYFGALKEIDTGSEIDNNLSLEDDFGLEIPVDFGVGGMAGTSVATAKVTGAASQVWAANPDLSYLQVKEILKRTAVDLNTPGWDSETGAGLVNLAAAVSLAKATSPQSHTPPPLNIPTSWDGEGKVTPFERPASLFSGQIERVGDVAVTGWLRVRSGPGLNFAEVTKIPAGSELIFNDQALGGWVHDFNNYGSSRLWYRLANGIGWMSALYIRNLGSNNQPQIPSGFQVDSQFAEAFQTYQGILGNPTSARYSLGNGVFRQNFEKGYIDWNGVASTVYQRGGETVGSTGRALAVPRRFVLHPRYPMRNWRRSTVAGIFDTKGRSPRNWVVRLDRPHGRVNYPHINLNPKFTGRPDPHIKVSPRLVRIARPLSRGAALISRVALPVGIGLSVWNIGSALRQDNWRLGRNSKDAIGEEAGGWAGAAGGAWAGAKIGAGIGFMVGGPAGAVVGGLVGGLVGAVAGSFAGSWAGRSLASRFWR
ncbi:S8 family serine peptidase [Nodosilinea sp. FACHB-131]|nr:S8 family serine peptidase [Nodosilinea sp. FACHB-131]